MRMPIQSIPDPWKIRDLAEPDYVRLSTFIMNHYGIKLPPNKRVFLQARLLKRLRHLKYNDFREYVDFVFSPEGLKSEVTHMIDAVSTNKTEFFREPMHFSYLNRDILKEYIERRRKSWLSVWSAGCSSGEEPYSIAMNMKELLQADPFFDFMIQATDISQSMLEMAKTGMYDSDRLAGVPDSLLRKYFTRGSGEYENRYRISNEIRSKVAFRAFNLLTPGFGSMGKFDIIFCRNVLIYFERPLQEQIIAGFCAQLNPGGILMLGHSESIAGFTFPLEHIKPTIYRKTDP
jgi:chemotaxis protein methyltransferase CheR